VKGATGDAGIVLAEKGFNPRAREGRDQEYCLAETPGEFQSTRP